MKYSLILFTFATSVMAFRHHHADSLEDFMNWDNNPSSDLPEYDDEQQYDDDQQSGNSRYDGGNQSDDDRHKSSSSSNAPSIDGEFSGQGTFYAPDTGACGITNTADDYIVALSEHLYDELNQGGESTSMPYCGRQILVTRGDRQVTVTVADRCVGCPYYNLDFSPAAFRQIGTDEEGVVPITWKWIS